MSSGCVEDKQRDSQTRRSRCDGDGTKSAQTRDHHNMHNMGCECSEYDIQVQDEGPLDAILRGQLLLKLPNFLLQLFIPVLQIPDGLPEPFLHLFARGNEPLLAQKLFRNIVKAVERGRERVMRRRQVTWGRYERVCLVRSAIHNVDRTERLAESRAARFGVTP